MKEEEDESSDEYESAARSMGTDAGSDSMENSPEDSFFCSCSNDDKEFMPYQDESTESYIENSYYNSMKDNLESYSASSSMNADLPSQCLCRNC